MSSFVAKPYQTSVLESVQAYLQDCAESGNADTAFYATTRALWNVGQPFRPLAGYHPGMPYFCLRVPTGGGKTWLAASAVQLVNRTLLRQDHGLFLWLVPSEAIREQTFTALRNPAHPYHAALAAAGPVVVIGVDEALSLTRATLDTATVVIVATAQAFRREDTQGLRVYRSNGALMHHFESLTREQRDGLLREGETVPYSLANVLRLRRPFLIVDEAHNARTGLTFETFARFNPSGIMELTATPDTEVTPSNVLHSVGAAELKAAEMIKLPVVLEAEPDWQRCLADALARRNELQVLAEAEQRAGAAYLRPLVLVQAEARREGVDTLTPDKVRQELIDNHNLPEDQVVIATGEERGLEAIDAEYPRGIADPACPVRVVITQKALAEGWDCPSAYVLVSLSASQSSTAVEQLLGRVLRQPDARLRVHPALNQSYAFVRSADFTRVAGELRDRLVQGAGFDRKEASQFVTAARADQGRMDFGSGRVAMRPVVVTLPEKPALRSVDKSLRDKVVWDNASRTLTITAPISEEEDAALQTVVTDPAAQAAIAQASVASRTTAIEHFQTPAEAGVPLRVPQLALRVQGALQLFDDPEVLEFPWDLSQYDAGLSLDDRRALGAASRVAGGLIDIDGGGRVTFEFLPELQRDLGLIYTPEHWDEARLARWLCRNLPEPSLTHASKQAFVAAWLRGVLDLPDFTLAKANQYKTTLRELLTQTIRCLRREAVQRSYQSTLFGEGHEQRVAVGPEQVFTFHPQGYAPTRDYDARKSEYGAFDFRKHYYGRIGDFDSREEFECATHIDGLAQRGLIKHWVRNLVRKEGSAFFLQKADGKFWPDFVCELPDGTILVVEYKGAQGWTDAQDDRDIGGLWEAMSEGRCRFVMVRDRNWQQIDNRLI